MKEYRSDVELGEHYRDEQTGIEGVATAVTFYQYGCERVTVEAVVDGKIEEYAFDAPRLRSLSTGMRAEAEDKGGPDRIASPARRPTPRSGTTR